MKLKVLFKKRKWWEYLTYLSIVFSGIGIDALTKHLATVFLKPIDTQPIINGVIHLTYHENTGAAWGMLKDAPWVFNTVSTVAITAMLIYLFLGHASTLLQAISISMIISGGIGNMIERLGQGFVVDFIDFRLINFPIFNGADSFVCVGAGLLILSLILDVARDYSKNRGEEN